VTFALIACTAASAQTTQPLLPPLETRPQERDRLADVTVADVKGFRFEGNSVMSDKQLLKVIERYVGRRVTSEDLEEARQALTLHYINAGYVNSGAILPDQTIRDGIITFRIVEGRVTDIELTGQRTPKAKRDQPTSAPVSAELRPGFRKYVLDRIKLGTTSPLNLVRLRDKLELLRQNANVQRINAELRPGASPGEATLDVAVEEARPYQLGLQFNNRRPPSIGAERFELLASHSNITGYGDALSLRYGINKGGLEDFDFAGLDDFDINYTIPVSPQDTTITFSISHSDTLVIEEPFFDLDIESESESYAITVRHPFYRSPSTEFGLSLSGAFRHNKSFLLGEPFSFSPGAVDGVTDVTVMRFGQDFLTRNQRRAISARSTMSIGVDAFGANASGAADGQFFAWLGQAQYVRRIGDTDWQWIARSSAQLADDALPSLEQISIGGFDTVRGYRENELVRDNGLIGSLELHIPLMQAKAGYGSALELIPFFDIGYGWNDIGIPDDQALASIGIGLAYTPNRHFSAQLYYGYALIDPGVEDEEEDLQDYGIHFNVLWLAF
jgi:hemolysin activation/secretion protein